MRHFVRQLRKKPTHIKERIALGVTFAGTMMVVFFWLTIVRYEILPQEKIAESKSPFQLVGDVFKDAYKGTVAGVGGVTGFYEPEEPAGKGKLIVVPQDDIFKKETPEDTKDPNNIFEVNE